MPGYRDTRRHAAAIICGSRATLDDLARSERSRAVYVPENGVDADLFRPCRNGATSPAPALLTSNASAAAAEKTRRAVRLAFVGRLVPVKGVDMLIEACAPLMRQGELELDIIGDGEEKAVLHRLAQTLGVAQRVTFAGWIAHRDLPQRLRKSSILGFPSVRDFGGGVVLEAMASGLAPVVADFGGPAELVTADTGIKVPLAPRGQYVLGLRGAIERLVHQPDLTRAIGDNARRRVLERFTWQAKARQMLDVYRWVLGGRAKPRFDIPGSCEPCAAAHTSAAP
jgi:glycosyltransferase involved in cell wall biosynthesis